MGTVNWVLKYKCIGPAKKKTTQRRWEAKEQGLFVEMDSTGGSVWVGNVAFFHGTVHFHLKTKQNGVVRHKQRLLFGCSTCVVVGLCLVGPHTSLNAPPVTILKFLGFEQRTLHFHVALGLSSYVNSSASNILLLIDQWFSNLSMYPNHLEVGDCQ